MPTPQIFFDLVSFDLVNRLANETTSRSTRKFCNACRAGFSLERLKSLLRSRSVSAGETLRNFMFTVLGICQAED